MTVGAHDQAFSDLFKQFLPRRPAHHLADGTVFHQWVFVMKVEDNWVCLAAVNAGVR